jgi:hypothetical protein
MERSTIVPVVATLMFMMGVLLIGIAELNAKVAYLVGHVVQAVLIALLSKYPLKSRTINSIWWEVHEPRIQSIQGRRDAFLWACKQTTRDSEWMKLCNLADTASIAFIQAHLNAPSGLLPSNMT